MPVQSLNQKDPLEEGMATHSSILAWRVPWTEGAWYRVTKGLTQLKRLSMYTHTYGEDWVPWWLSREESACQCSRHRRRVRSLGWEDLLEEGMATHSSILAWRVPWTEEPGGLQSMGLQRVRQD